MLLSKCVVLVVGALERGAVYKFELSARNDVNYGDAAVQTIRTPDGSE